MDLTTSNRRVEAREQVRVAAGLVVEEAGRIAPDAQGVLRIVVDGPPPGKPRMTQRDTWKKRPCVMRYRDWCDRVRKAVGIKLPPAKSVQALDWVAYFEPPKSRPKKLRELCIGHLHCAKPDRDNIDKAVLDCLYREDSSIAMGTIQKRWGSTARIEITIHYKTDG